MGRVASRPRAAAAFRRCRSGWRCPRCRASRLQRIGHRLQHVQHGLLAGRRFAARLDRSDRRGKGAGGIGQARLGRKFLAQRQEQRAIERAGSPADGHDQMGSYGLQHVGQRLCGEIVAIGQHGLEATLHVEAVIAIADGPVEIGQLDGVAAIVSAIAPISRLLDVTVELHVHSVVSAGRDPIPLADRNRAAAGLRWQHRRPRPDPHRDRPASRRRSRPSSYADDCDRPDARSR